MAAISGFITAYLKIQDGGQTKELKEHRIHEFEILCTGNICVV